MKKGQSKLFDTGVCMKIQLLSLSKIIRYVNVSSQQKHWSTRACQATRSTEKRIHTFQLTDLSASGVCSHPSDTPPFWKCTVEAHSLAGYILTNLQLRGSQGQFILLIISSVCSSIHQSKQFSLHHDQITIQRNKLVFCLLFFCCCCLAWFHFIFISTIR